MSMYGTEPDSLDPGRLRDEQERIDPPTCDHCGSTAVRHSLAGVGVACSHKCLNALCLQHESAMQRRSA